MNKRETNHHNGRITAADLMRTPVECVYIEDSIDAVAHLFVTKGIGAAPVIGKTGAAIGVITKSDLARYAGERFRTTSGTNRRSHPTFLDIHPGFHLEPGVESIREWVTLNIESVSPRAPLREVLRKMLKNRIHHLFVKADTGDKIVGVISTIELTRYLNRTVRKTRGTRGASLR